MVLTKSTTLAIGSPASAFSLTDVRNGQVVSLSQYSGQPILIAFICNHCPYVVHLLDAFNRVASTLSTSGIATVAICANDASQYPADSPENMARLAEERGFAFPYCHDESQEIAKAYTAVCTPDLFLFDARHNLYYRGQFDGTRPGSGSANGEDLTNTAAQLLDGRPAPRNVKPSVGCSIKWKH